MIGELITRVCILFFFCQIIFFLFYLSLPLFSFLFLFYYSKYFLFFPHLTVLSTVQRRYEVSPAKGTVGANCTSHVYVFSLFLSFSFLSLSPFAIFSPFLRLFSFSNCFCLPYDFIFINLTKSSNSCLKGDETLMMQRNFQL